MKYRTIVVDPPWGVGSYGIRLNTPRWRSARNGALPYRTMSIDEIRGGHWEGIGDIREIAADDAFMFLWATQKYLPDAFGVLNAWGFKYRFMMTWHKSGGPQICGYPSFNAEHIVVGAIGKPKFIDTKAFPIAFYAKRGRHSEKPDAFYDLLRRVAPKPAIDVFNRRHIIGFDTAGDEAEQAPQRMLL